MQECDALIDSLAQVSFATIAALSRLAAEHDLSLTQLRVLGILRDRNVRMTELANYLGLEKSSLSGLIDRAEERGLVSRARSKIDGRVFDVALTDKGRQLAETATERSRELLWPLVDRLDAKEQHSLRRLLDKIA